MAENVTMKLIGLITTVLVLGAAYLFIVKPVLDTTNNAFDSVNDTINSSFEDAGLSGLNIDEIQNGDFSGLETQIKQAGLGNAEQRRAEQLLGCIQRVQPNTTKMQACAEKYQ